MGGALAFIDRFRHWWRGRPAATTDTAIVGRQRGAVDHVIVLDGTFSSLTPGQETNVGQIYRLLTEGGRRAGRDVYYEPGLQWAGWRNGWAIIQGHGLDDLICRAYGWLASHYRSGDRIFLIGYSRGAYAVRSLAGLIDRVGLLKREHATERGVTLVWRHYQTDPDSTGARAFARRFCHAAAPIEMVGVFDTVKSLGIKVPLLGMLIKDKTSFHSHALGRSVRHGFHALALDENRNAFAPVLWESAPDWVGNVEQVWFRGAHGDVGGQTGDFPAARPLANIPLVWMLDRIAAVGLSLPEGWRDRFVQDVNAPMVGTTRAWGKWFVIRRRRRVMRDPSERLHPSVAGVATARWRGWFGSARQV